MVYDPNDDDYSAGDDDLKHQASKSPAVKGEEDVFSGDAPTGEPADIDEELEKVGLRGDRYGDKKEGPVELGINEELD